VRGAHLTMRMLVVVAAVSLLLSGCARLQTWVSGSKVDELEAENLRLKTETEAYQRLNDRLQQELHDKTIQLEQLAGGGVRLRLTDAILFDTGKSDLRPEAMATLTKISDALTSEYSGRRISVEGHADPRPIATAKFPSNWELSASRACAVARFFEQHGMKGASIQAVGHGPYKPIAENTTQDGMQRNRRVEIIILPAEEPQVVQPS